VGEQGFSIRSSDFEHGGVIPSRFTCEGDDTSPHLSWTGAPAGTASFALIVDDPDAPDPDAPKMTWVHWVVYDLPAGTTELAAGLQLADAAPSVRFALNSWQRNDYGGPCPPIGRHRYFFRLYALDCELGNLGAADRDAVDAAMKEHVLAEATLMGTYQKGDP
jgi:Raf kinase inhibitor-like YbhB/YbcL family protein